jgi:hypothetical protein
MRMIPYIENIVIIKVGVYVTVSVSLAVNSVSNDLI